MDVAGPRAWGLEFRGGRHDGQRAAPGKLATEKPAAESPRWQSRRPRSRRPGKPAVKTPAAAKPAAKKPAVKPPAAKTAKPHAAKPAPPAAPASEQDVIGTDLDWEEAEAIGEEREVISDGTPYIEKIEMNAYKRVLKWVLNQPWSVLEQRAKKEWAKKIPTYDHFNSDPEKWRFQLVELNLDARSLRTVDKVQEIDEPLSEVWGVTSESGDHLYDVVVVDRPPGMPIGDIFEGAKVVGYFFKMQGYVPRAGGHQADGPVLDRRIQWQPASPPPGMQALRLEMGAGVPGGRLGDCIGVGICYDESEGGAERFLLGAQPGYPLFRGMAGGAIRRRGCAFGE